ncbi:uncharacterized protein LOC105178714 [Sesamum indicum]|uniref:Uncharacterized protein LOC105178714 n=1 Tax=Sesamum indicum TaxID=4182 RepID=A0A6I9UMM7_SESIN|nr:uncharacterized protein LOC105178714 [Sesamum indicum]
MASELSATVPQSSLTNMDEFEGLEVTEFDPNTLQELLYEPAEELESGAAFMQPKEVDGTNLSPTVENYWVLEDIKDDVQDFNWLYMVEETAPPCNDLGAWYEDQCIEELSETFVMGDYSLSHNAILCDEIGYIGLWQEN